MSLVFGGSGGQFLTGGSNITLPNGDWCIAAFLRISDNTGTERQTVVSAGATAASLELTFGALRLQDPGSTPGSALLRVYDGAGGAVNLRSTTLDVPVGSWFLLVGQRTGSTKELWTVPMAASPVPVLVGSTTGALGACAFATPAMIGRRRCTQVTNDDLKSSTVAWVARANASLSQGQMKALAALACPKEIAPWIEYMPFMVQASSYKAPIGGGTYTQTGFPTLGTQPVRLW